MALNMPLETRNPTEDPDSVQACSGLATDHTRNVSVGRYQKVKEGSYLERFAESAPSLGVLPSRQVYTVDARRPRRYHCL